MTKEEKLRVARQLEIGTATGQQLEGRSRHQVAEEIPLLLVKSSEAEMAPGVLHVLGDGQLRRGVHGEHIELVHLAKFGHQYGRGDHVANLPAGELAPAN